MELPYQGFTPRRIKDKVSTPVVGTVVSSPEECELHLRVSPSPEGSFVDALGPLPNSPFFVGPILFVVEGRNRVGYRRRYLVSCPETEQGLRLGNTEALDGFGQSGRTAREKSWAEELLGVFFRR